MAQEIYKMEVFLTFKIILHFKQLYVNGLQSFKKLYVFGKEVYFNMNTLLLAVEIGHRNQSTGSYFNHLLSF